MFKKFKDKLAEEMKQSPARLQASMQQLAQAVVSPALSNSSIQEISTSNDNFSLTEEGDETPKNSPAKHGFQKADLVSPTTNSMGISRRSSLSSITSDTSSLFVNYETPPNLYHLQSDIDQSASEMEENISPQLERVTKDQLYSAYQKVQAKYHKYRGRYTDLATHYRELQMARDKLESVLVETQDKVLRRVADLKEQCQLEQQAKAHLEEALRNDIEEKDHIINTLNTKIRLLQVNGPAAEQPAPDTNSQKQNVNLIDLTTEPANNTNESALATENAQLKDKMKKLENLVLKYKDSLKRNKDKFIEVMNEKTALETEFEKYKTSNAEKLKVMEEELVASRAEVGNLADQMNILKKREEESAISLAENKLSIHRELEDKEVQIKQLRLELKHMTESKDSLSETIEKYKTEVEKLKVLQNTQSTDPEKKEIIQDISRGKSEALKLMQQEMEQKLSNLEEKIWVKHQEEADRGKEAPKKLEKAEMENIPENAEKLSNNEMLESLKSAITEKENELREMTDKLEKLQKLSEEYKCEKNKLQNELSQCRVQCKELKSERDAEKVVMEEKKREAAMTIEKLQATVQSLDRELENMRGALTDRDKVCENFNAKVQEYAAMLEKAKEKLLSQEAVIKNLEEKVQDTTEINKLQEELENKNTELLGLHSELKSCRATISDFRDKLQADSAKTDLLCKQRNSLIKHILNYKNSIQRLKEDYRFIKSNMEEQRSEQDSRISVLNQMLVKSLTSLLAETANRDEELKDFQELQCRYSEVKVELAEAIRLKTKLELDMEKCNEQLKEMSIKLKEKHNVEVKNCKLIAEIDNLNFKLYDLQKLVTEMEELKKELNNANIRNELLSTEVVDLRKELEEVDHTVTTNSEELENEKTMAKNLFDGTNLSSQSRLQMQESTNKRKIYDSTSRILRIKQRKLERVGTRSNNKTSTESQAAEIQRHLKSITRLRAEKEKIAELLKFTRRVTNSKVFQIKRLKVICKRQKQMIDELNDEINELKMKNNELTSKSKLTEEEIEALKSENTELATLKESNAHVSLELEELKSIKEDISLENKNLKDKQNEFLKSNQELREHIEVLRTKIADYEKANQQLRKDVQRLNDDIESYKNELTLRNESIKKLENHVATIEAELQLTGTKLAAQTEELPRYRKEAEEIRENLLKENEELRDRISSLNDELENKKSIEDENSRLALDLGEVEKKLVELKSVQEENAALKCELNDMKTAKNTQNEELQSQLTSLTVEKEKLVVELEESKLMVDEKVAELKLLDTRNLDLLNEVERLNGLYLAAEEKAKELEALKNTVKGLEEKRGKLRSEVQSLKESNAKLQEEVQNAYTSKTTDESLAKRADSLQETNKKLEAQLDEALITFQAKELQMQMVNDELKNQSDKLKEELKTNEEEQSMRLKQLVKEFQAQLQDKEEELQAALEKRFDRQQNYESSLIQQYKEQLKDFQVELTAKSEQIENLLLENKELTDVKMKEVDQLVEKIALIKKEHLDEIREIEKKWKAIMQQRTEKLEAKHDEEINELTREWRNERRPDVKTDKLAEELESTSRVAMAAVQSNTGSFHTLQQTLTAQQRELSELRKLVKLRHDTLDDSTEIEYLRNILFEYMMGRETMVLARVIAAVVKFDQEQTAKILKKEEDKMTLLGQLGLT